MRLRFHTVEQPRSEIYSCGSDWPAKLLATLTTFAFRQSKPMEFLEGLGLTVCVPGAAAVGDCAESTLPAWGGRSDKFKGFH